MSDARDSFRSGLGSIYNRGNSLEVPLPKTYTLRRSWPDNPDRPEDYVFRVDGKDAGRCYRHIAGGVSRRGCAWHWTIYGAASSGDEDTLDKAKEAFRKTFESLGQGLFKSSECRSTRQR